MIVTQSITALCFSVAYCCSSSKARAAETVAHTSETAHETRGINWAPEHGIARLAIRHVTNWKTRQF